MRRLAWSIVACTTLFSLYVIFFSSPSVSDSATVLSSEAMEEVRGAACETCTSATWAQPGCDTKDCWYVGPFSHKRHATTYTKCWSTSSQRACKETYDSSDPEDKPGVVCAHGAMYWSPYCHSWSKVADTFWRYPYDCHSKVSSC